jgi:phosphoribosylformimino-5-aminoimidazole carboxamide ribotide isomerase
MHALKAVESSGIAGVISGRAIYDGRLDLGDALTVLSA